MTEAVTSGGSPEANPSSLRQSRKPATVSASALALHLDCSRTYIGKLEAEGVIQQQMGQAHHRSLAETITVHLRGRIIARKREDRTSARRLGQHGQGRSSVQPIHGEQADED